jgi:glycerol-3-phosphate acyltransferase PlsY
MIEYLIFLIAGYIAGSIPFGLILTRLAGYGDIRQIGSGNIGATNVLRTGNKWLALATVILDSGKGAFAVLLSARLLDALSYVFNYQLCFPNSHTALTPDGRILCDFDITIETLIIVGLGAVLGHCYPVWLKFKGGKGVSTALGTLLAAVPFAGIFACAVWLVMALTRRISSLSALTAMGTAPIIAFIFYGLIPALIVFVIAAIVFFRHKDNILRLLNGTEPRIGNKKKLDEKPVSNETP